MPLDLPTWNLETALSSLDGGKNVVDAECHLVAKLDELSVFFNEHGIGPGSSLSCLPENVALFDGAVVMAAEVVEAERVLSLYWAGRCWADGKDQEAASRSAALQHSTAKLPVLLVDLKAWITRFQVDRLIAVSTVAAENRYWMEQIQKGASHELTAGEEQLLTHLRLSGSTAWQQLRSDLISSLTAEIDGERIPFSAVQNMSRNPDKERRRAANRASQDALASIEVPVAACLSAIRGENLALSARRGWKSPLELSLNNNGIDGPVLHMIHEAVEYLLPTLRKYAKCKAGLLGYNALPAWEVFSPLPGGSSVSWPQALEFATAAASAFSPDFASLVRRAVDEEWIDAAHRDGKRQTPLCMPMRHGESRLMLSFDGSMGGVKSLAHELGHAYHYYLLRESSEFQIIPPLALAETASIFSESLLLAIASGCPSSVRLELMNADLIGHFQVVLDTYGRYLFETELTNRLKDGPLASPEICDLLAEAQEATYGDCVDPATLDRYSWITKPHYYSTDPFTNWPYYFGLLLSLGLFASGDFSDPDMQNRFKRLLADAGSATPVSLALDCGADLNSEEFWFLGAEQIERRVNEFVAAAGIGTSL